MEFDDLAKQLEEGKVDSSGRFTLSPEAYAKQYGPLIALEPNIFLGRLLQAANVSDAKEVRYLLRTNSVQITIALSDAAEYMDMLHYFSEGRLPRSATQHYLHLAFSSALARIPKVLRWRVTGPLGGYTVDLLEEKEPGVLARDRSAEAVLDVEFSEPVGLLNQISSYLGFSKYWIGLRAGIHSFLTRRCCFSAVPVRLDDVMLQFNPDRAFISLLDNSRAISKANYPLRAVQMELLAKFSPKAKVFNGPSPASLRAMQCLLGQRLYGTSDDGVFAARSRLRWDQGTRLLKLDIPGSYTVAEHASSREGVWELEQFVAGEYERLTRGEIELLQLKRQWTLKADRFSLPEATAFSKPSQLCCTKLLALREENYRSFLVPIKDGFALTTEMLESWPPGSIVVAAVPDSKVDGLGLRIVQDEAYQTLISETGEELERLSHLERTKGNRVKQARWAINPKTEER